MTAFNSVPFLHQPTERGILCIQHPSFFEILRMSRMNLVFYIFLALQYHIFSSSALVLHRPSHEKTSRVYSNAFDIDSLDVLPNGEYSRILIKKKRRVERRFLRQRLANRLLNRLNRNATIPSEDEDGYMSMMKPYRPLLEQLLRIPFKIVRKIAFPDIAKEPGTLILVRHGESLWNYNKTFTGWADPDLSERGYREVEHAARLLLEGGYEIDIVFTSRLKRAIRSVWILLKELNQVYLPVFKSWRANERHYGALTGLSKTDTAAEIGADIVQQWRSSLRAQPPPLQRSDVYWPGRDRRYADLSPSQIPLTESLLDCMQRIQPLWEDKITYELRKGSNVLVLAHANTLRGLVKIIDDIGDDEIQDVAIPTGIPIVYKFNNIKELKPISWPEEYLTQRHMKGVFLEKPGLLKEALKLEQEWSSRVPGYDSAMGKEKNPTSPLERSLNKLKAERELGQLAGRFKGENFTDEDDGTDGNQGRPIQFKKVDELSKTRDRPEVKGRTKILDEDEDDDLVQSTIISSNPCQTPLPSTVGKAGNVPIRTDATIVIIRHGKTEHNKLGLFTGWEDAPLAQDGVEEARRAGKLLKAHGFEFDVVYTSWLSRAIETAWIVMDELDCLWLPIIKTWRFNERMYGSLTGLSKNMVKQRHGEKQFKLWRRGYKVRPPSVSSFSVNYPGNDIRYTKFMKDVRYSLSETVIRSIEGRGLKLHRKFPKAESLKDCMDRTIPYFSQVIVPEAINKGKRVLIASSENAIRGLLMELCEIPEERIVELEIPNGLPLIFDVKSKCIKLLDDGTGKDPLETYNFGKAASFLFRPCEKEDGTPDEECDIRFMTDGLYASKNDQETVNQIKRPIK